MNDSNPHTQLSFETHGTPRGRVLILESDRLIKQLVIEWLQMSGYETVCASDTAAAAQVAGAGCDLMLADVRPPLESARASVARLALAVPATPIIAMSADVLSLSCSVLEGIARELGVASVLVKPFTRDTLLDAIRRALA